MSELANKVLILLKNKLYYSLNEQARVLNYLKSPLCSTKDTLNKVWESKKLWNS